MQIDETPCDEDTQRLSAAYDILRHIGERRRAAAERSPDDGLLGPEPWPADAQRPTQVTIYGLRDPRTQQVRYVGQTHNDLSHRLRQHLVEARHGRGRKNAWLRALRAAGLRPEIVALCTPCLLLCPKP